MFRRTILHRSLVTRVSVQCRWKPGGNRNSIFPFQGRDFAHGGGYVVFSTRHPCGTLSTDLSSSARERLAIVHNSTNPIS
jgi:hypothetical protein